MSKLSVLLVARDEPARKANAALIEGAGFAVETAGLKAEAQQRLRHPTFDLLVMDPDLPDGDGLELLAEVANLPLDTGLVLLLGSDADSGRVRAAAPPGCKIVHRECDPRVLFSAIMRSANPSRMDARDAVQTAPAEERQPADGLVGNSSPVRRLIDLIEQVANVETTVLIRGESGVGKELVARAVHRRSRRAPHPLVTVDCASLHDNLLQSELFGHERGAYTGADRMKRGLFEVADRGTIFLDEIGELTPALQVKLLRVLETGVFRRLGGTEALRVNVRVIAATNRPLEAMIADGRFREDLFYRINVFPLEVPPLRSHPEDIRALAMHFIRHSAAEPNQHVTLSAEALLRLERYGWPGNVRELENVVERALILCDARTIEPRHLPVAIQHGVAADAQAADAAPVALRDVERRHIMRVVAECGGHRERAAKLLEISERTLYRRLSEVASPGRTRCARGAKDHHQESIAKR